MNVEFSNRRVISDRKACSGDVFILRSSYDNDVTYALLHCCKGINENEELRLLTIDGVGYFGTFNFSGCTIKECLDYIRKTHDMSEFIPYEYVNIKIEGDVVDVK